jgi:hypothetical protein
MTRIMMKDQVKAVLDRVLIWPPGRQADVAQDPLLGNAAAACPSWSRER